jgi:hypothetical protein
MEQDSKQNNENRLIKTEYKEYVPKFSKILLKYSEETEMFSDIIIFEQVNFHTQRDWCHYT